MRVDFAGSDQEANLDLSRNTTSWHNAPAMLIECTEDWTPQHIVGISPTISVFSARLSYFRKK
jgi:hypothetical protein